MITTSQLRFSYPFGGFHSAVDELSTQAGKTDAVIGASGAGKTTLLNLMAGMMIQDDGSVMTNGTEISNLEETKHDGKPLCHS